MTAPRWQSGLTVGVTLALAFALKQHYRDARPEDLEWILRPTTSLVTKLSGVPFEREAGIGYTSRDARFSIVPACAGVNFLIVAFVSIVLVNEARCARLRDCVLLVGAAALGACALAVTANAVRITIAVALHVHRVSWGFWSEARLHELEGVLVYLVVLLAASWASSKVQRAPVLA